MNQDGDINLDVSSVIGYRIFSNKLLNATRFALISFGAEYKCSVHLIDESFQQGNNLNLWILSMVNGTINEINAHLKSSNLGDSVIVSYRFWMSKLCGIFLESVKPTMMSKD